jgi:hypothetical protein
MGKTAGRWTKEEHKKFVQGKKILHIFRILTFLSIAIRLYGKDWRKVEEFVKTRSGA